MALFDAILPEGWSWQPIERHYRITKKPRALDPFAHESVPFVPMDGVPAGGEQSVRFEMRTPEQIASGTYFERGDVLLSKITPSFENGKQGKPNELPLAFGYGSTELIPIQPVEDANADFLFYYLLHPEVRTALAARMEGSTGRQRVPESAVRELPMPVPEPEEQASIAEVLSIVQRSIAHEQRAYSVHAEMKKAAMAQLFSRGLYQREEQSTEVGMIPTTWEIIPLGSVGRIGNGSTPKRTEARYWDGGVHPWLTSGKIHEGIITHADQYVTDVAIRECHLPIVPAGSVLIAITGQGKTLGNAAITTLDTSVSQHLAYCTVERADVDAQFLRFYLASRYDYLRGLGQAGGSTKGALTCAGLKMVRVPKPPIEEQREIARTLGILDRKIAHHERRRALLAELFNTLLDDLITGRRRALDLSYDASVAVA